MRKYVMLLLNYRGEGYVKFALLIENIFTFIFRFLLSKLVNKNTKHTEEESKVNENNTQRSQLFR